MDEFELVMDEFEFGRTSYGMTVAGAAICERLETILLELRAMRAEAKQPKATLTADEWRVHILSGGQ